MIAAIAKKIPFTVYPSTQEIAISRKAINKPDEIRTIHFTHRL